MKIINADCRNAMQNMGAESFDSIVTDPPYGLSFMGKGWDHGVPGVEFWTEALRVAKPGTHLLAFGGTRTYHRLACAIEDAGWEIRDCVMWVYGSGFPKSHDVSKAIDREAGAERKVVGVKENKGRVKAEGWGMSDGDGDPITAPATDAAKQWSGWGTALKPAYEPIIVARKPLIGTVAETVLMHGTGAINVDGCRVAGKVPQVTRSASSFLARHDGRLSKVNPSGRWPANLIHDGSEEVVGLFPETTTGNTKPIPYTNSQGKNVFGRQTGIKREMKGDSGSAARFFYCAKASKADRDEGIESCAIAKRQGNRPRSPDETGKFPDHDHRERTGNFHPTVKPTDLMRYLCRLVTPPGGIVLDPFTGSGSTGKAAILEGFDFVGIEQDADYAKIAEARIKHAIRKKSENLPF